MSGLSRKAGFTALELTIGIALMALFMIKFTFIARQLNEASSEQTRSMMIEDKAREVLDRIALAVMGSDRQMLVPNNTVFPFHTTRLRYQVSLGIDAGNVVWSDIEQIVLDDGTEVVWVERPGEADERSVVWTNMVRPFLEGELPNGIDDNGNGLVDEEGLNFVISPNSVTVRLTMRGLDGAVETGLRTVETKVVCRNNPNDVPLP